MPSLSDMISKAQSQFRLGSAVSTIKGSARTSLSSTVREIQSIPAGIIRSAENQVVTGLNGAVNDGLNSVRDAANLAIHGDLSGALTKIASGPKAVMGNALAAFGLSDGVALSKSSDPTNSLAGALARSDPLMSYDWYCVLPDVTPIDGAPVALPWYYVEDANTPFRTFDQRAIYAQGRNKHYPSMYSVDGLRLGIYADTDNKAQAYLDAWQGAMVRNVSARDANRSGGGFGRPSDYKKNITIFLVSATRRQVLSLQYTECWPTTIDAFTLDSGASNRLVNSVNFSVGDVFVTLFKADNSMSNQLLGDNNIMGSLLSKLGSKLLA